MRRWQGVVLVLGANALGYIGCATLGTLNNPKDDDALAHCRELARNVKAEAGGDAGRDAYLACVHEAGLQ